MVGAFFYETIYYPNNMIDRDKQDVLIKEYRKKTEMLVIEVKDQVEFVAKMDELYVKPDTVFLVDYDLKGNMSLEDFSSRINVRYALHRNKEDKIWFYTSGPYDVRAMLREVFPGRTVDVSAFHEGQLYWSERQVKSVVNISV